MIIPYVALELDVSRQKYVCSTLYHQGSVRLILDNFLTSFQIPPVTTYAAIVDTNKNLLWIYFEYRFKVSRTYADKVLRSMFTAYTLHGATTRTLAAILPLRNAYFTGAAAACQPMPITARLAQHVARSASLFACDICATMHATPCFSCPAHTRIACRDASADKTILNGLARYMLGHLLSVGDKQCNAWERRWHDDVVTWAKANGYPTSLSDLGNKLQVPQSKVAGPQPGLSPYRVAECQIKTAQAVHAIAMDTYCRTSKVCVGCGHTVCHKCTDKHVCTLMHTSDDNQFVQRHDMIDIDADCTVTVDLLRTRLPHLRFPTGVRNVAGIRTYSTKAQAYCESMKLLRTVGDYAIVQYKTVDHDQHIIVVCGVARMLVSFNAFSSQVHHNALRSYLKTLYTPTHCQLNTDT